MFGLPPENFQVGPPMAATLVDVLNISVSEATNLLEETRGDAEGAIALHFASGRRRERASSPRSTIVNILAGEVSRAQAQALLERAGGSVEVALAVFYEQGPPQILDRNQPGQPSSAPITIDDDDEESRGSSEDDLPLVPSSQRGLVRSPVRAGRGTASQRRASGSAARGGLPAPSAAENMTSSDEEDVEEEFGVAYLVPGRRRAAGGSGEALAAWLPRARVCCCRLACGAVGLEGLGKGGVRATLY